MITIIIPALNEQNTISQVVGLVSKNQSVTEIPVIDDKSLDSKLKNDKSGKVRTHTSTKSGKGSSMHDWMLLDGNEIIVFLDTASKFHDDLTKRK